MIRKNVFKKCAAAFCLFAACITYAQSVPDTPDTLDTQDNGTVLRLDDFISEYVSRRWTANDGLPGNTVTDIIQNQSGYLYIGTYDGLAKFDGIKFTILNKSEDARYAFESARSLFEDSQGNLWSGSNDEGVFCITPDGEVLSFSEENGLPNNSIRCICEDTIGNIWIGTAGGVVYITKTGAVITPDPEGLERFGDKHPRCISLYCDTAGQVWIASAKKGGIYCYANGSFTKYNKITAFNEPEVTVVTQDNTGVFWFGVSPCYAVRIDERGSRVFDLSDDTRKITIINSIYQDTNGTLWFGTDSGVAIYRSGQILHYTEANGLVNNSVNKIIEDREGNMWFGTDRGGLQEMNRGRFKIVQLPTSVNAIAEGQDNRVWVGTDSGLFCYREEGADRQLIEEYNIITRFCRNVRIRHVGCTSDGDILISCYAKLGQLRFHPDGTLVHQWLPENGLTGGKIRVAIEASNKDLYIGTTTGLNVVDHETGSITIFTREQALANEYIMCLYEDPATNQIWVGTDGGGIYILQDKKILRTYTTADGLAGNVIFKINKSSDGSFWICTGTGISCLNRDTFFNFNSSNGLGTSGIFQMLRDDTGLAWLTSNRGICSLQITQFHALTQDLLPRLDPRYFGSTDGLTTDGVTSTSLSMKDSQGRIWFTLLDGFAVYDPRAIQTSKTPPLVHVESVTIDDKTFSCSPSLITAPAGSKRITFTYTGISFASPSLLRFKYMLEGFDTKYSPLHQERQISYTNLQPGRYTFRVIAVNSDGTESEFASAQMFEQKAYIYERPQFWGAMTLVIIIIAVILIKIRFTAMKRIQHHLERMVKLRTEELEKEKERSDDLLLNILPSTVADELKASPGKEISQYKKNVSVLFADIVDFTQTMSGISADKLVHALNALYSRFDTRAEKYGIEKIKTIGDSYMAAAGLTVADPKGAQHLIEFARGMLEDVEDYNQTAELPFAIRIGINSGDVVAGVIGKTKFIYDVWGDSVNVASRMQTTGKPGRIHVSETTWELSRDNVAFESEEVIQIKGKGLTRTFYTK